MIVVDTNVIACLILPGPFASMAEGLLARDGDWRVPVLWRSEFRNVVVGFARRCQLSWEEARALQREAETLLRGSDFDVHSDRVLELAQKSGCSSYDCEFVALAEHFDVPLVTMDRQVLRAFPGTAVPLSP